MSSARASVRTASPVRWLASTWELLRNFAYDFRRFRKASFLDGPQDRENRRAEIHILAHMLEYGMSLSDPRLGFGMDKVRLLAAETGRYLAEHGNDATTEMAISVLEAYAQFNADRGGESAEAAALAAALRRSNPEVSEVPAGSEPVTAAAIRQQATMDFVAFMEARHSVRQYDRRPVDMRSVHRAVRAAQQSPSSCNRQTCKVYCFTERDSIAKVLAHHNGNRGFGDQLGGVFVVAVDLSHWNTVGERNQGWVDGGMFAMTLALGLHAEGLGACMLNWSADRVQDKGLRACVGIPDNEIVITLIGFGHMRDDFRVPVSRRKPLELVLRHEPGLS